MKQQPQRQVTGVNLVSHKMPQHPEIKPQCSINISYMSLRKINRTSELSGYSNLCETKLFKIQCILLMIL